MDRFAILFAMLFAMAEAGAQSPQEKAPAPTDELLAAPVCCRSPAGFPVEQVSMPIDVMLTFDRSAPAYSFSTGKSFFRMIELPPNDAPYVLSVESHVSAPAGAFDRGTLFFPVLVFLDENRKLLGGKRSWIFEAVRDLNDRLVGIKASLAVRDRIQRARYIVIQTENAVLSKAFEVPSQIGLRTVPSGAGVTWMPTSRGGYSVPFGVEGRVRLWSSSP